MRHRILSALALTAVVGGSILLSGGSAYAAVAHPNSANCANYYFGNDGYQDYFHIQCSPIGTGTWGVSLRCSNGITYSAGPYSNFQNVTIYCPHGMSAVQASVSSS